jgi:hypothetical protein
MGSFATETLLNCIACAQGGNLTLLHLPKQIRQNFMFMHKLSAASKLLLFAEGLAEQICSNCRRAASLGAFQAHAHLNLLQVCSHFHAEPGKAV